MTSSPLLPDATLGASGPSPWWWSFRGLRTTNHLWRWDALEPRVLNASGLSASILIFTDAAYENGVATWGCVLIDPSTGVREVSGGTIDPQLVSCWLQRAGKQVITQAEAFVVLLARKHYMS